jgi:hypothetical protein
MRIRAFLFSLALAASSVAALANHHSFSAYFDIQRPFSVTGTIVKVDWVNPAVFVHLRVEDRATGQTDAETLKRRKESGVHKNIADWTMHDLRRTAATQMAQAGVCSVGSGVVTPLMKKPWGIEDLLGFRAKS